jgi:hypothetical protein
MGSSGLCVVKDMRAKDVDMGQGEIDGNDRYLTVDKLPFEAPCTIL